MWNLLPRSNFSCSRRQENELISLIIIILQLRRHCSSCYSGFSQDFPPCQLQTLKEFTMWNLLPPSSFSCSRRQGNEIISMLRTVSIPFMPPIIFCNLSILFRTNSIPANCTYCREQINESTKTDLSSLAPPQNPLTRTKLKNTKIILTKKQHQTPISLDKKLAVRHLHPRKKMENYLPNGQVPVISLT